MAQIRTEITIQSTGEAYSAPGLLTVQAVKDFYADQISGLRNMTGSFNDREVDGVTVRFMTFSPQTGSKG